jgi:hypothetical protein
MSRKEYFLIGLVVVLAAIYAVDFTDWFSPREMHIEHAVRSQREAWIGPGTRMTPASNGVLGEVTFSLRRDFRLTSIKVVEAADFQTNKYAPALWELVSKKGSEPVNGFVYGCAVPGMIPARPNLEPEQLEIGVGYRLIVRSGSLTAMHDFELSGRGKVGR